MKHNGLVSLAFIVLSETTLAQNSGGEPRLEFQPPIARKQDAQLPPRPLDAADPDGVLSIEAELQKFRSDLHEFQTLREEVARELKSTEPEGSASAVQLRRDLLRLLT